jgi:hypothetical protein
LANVNKFLCQHKGVYFLSTKKIIDMAVVQIAHIFFCDEVTQQSTSTLLKMPQAKSEANYKVDTLIQVVESILPNGSQS